MPSAPVEHAMHADTAGYESSGRGGAGNIHERSRSREPAEEHKAGGGFGGLLHKVTHPLEHHHHHHQEPAQPTVMEE